MNKSKLVDSKIDELIFLAESENDGSAKTILFALRGARRANDEYLLVKNIQDFVKNVLLPLVDEKILAKEN